MEDESVLAKGLCERIGIDGSNLTHRPAGKANYELETPMPDHKKAVELVLEALMDPKHGVIASVDEIGAVGHRVLHGGKEITQSCVVDQHVKDVIRECFDLGPLHNPANLIGIEAVEAIGRDDATDVDDLADALRCRLIRIILVDDKRLVE